MKKILLTMILIMGVFLMLKPINAIIKDSIGNILFRGNVVTGIVDTDNSNGSYDVFISESDKAYPNIFTLAEFPDIEVGDKVRILYKNGDRNNPIILPPVTITAVTHRIYVGWESASYITYIEVYSDDGDHLDTWTIEATENIGNTIAVDSNDNVYTIAGNNRSIKKRNSSGEIVLYKSESNWIYNIAIGADGYIYTQEYDSGFNDGYISKRNTSDLVSVDTRSLGSLNTYYGMTIDSDGRIYMVNSNQQRYETWDFSSGLINYSTGSIEYNMASLAAIGSNLVNVDWMAHAIILPKNYSDGGVGSDVELTNLDRPMNVGMKGNNYLVVGYDNFRIVIGKYDNSLGKIWTKIVADGGYNVCNPIAAYPF